MSSPAAIEAARQLRELTADGYPLNWLAQQTLTSESTLGAIRAGRRHYIHWAVAEAITDAYLHLRGTNPATHGITAHATGIAQLTAGRNGWTTTRKDNP